MGQETCACGRAEPVRFVPSFTAQNAAAPTKASLVSLTMSLSTFLGLGDQPGRLDGYGPVAAGIARLIARDAARNQPAWTTWRCVVTDDVHGTVLGVTDPVTTPLWTPRHDPPEKLARLVTAMEPVCVFPGCRVPARTRTANRCDLDHRIPYNQTDPDGAAGAGGGARCGGRTCSCNLAPLCRTHHQQKTSGALKVRALHPEPASSDRPGQPLDVLEWTLPSGVTVRSHPHIAQPVSLAQTAAVAGGDVAADITTALQHIADRETRWAAHDKTRGPRRQTEPDEDWADQAWLHSRQRAASARAGAAAQARAEADEPCPF